MSILEEKGYKLGKEVGFGGSSKCYEVYCDKYKQSFVCKIVKDKALYINEIKFLTIFTHPNILKMYDYFESNGLYYLILEICPKGTIEDIIQHMEPLSNSMILEYTTQIVLGLEYVHSKGVAHMDIKPSNFFIGNRNIIKLADFGLAQTSCKKVTNTLNGTFCFVAPEIMLDKADYDPRKADMWSLGVSLFYITFRRSPWKHLFSLKEDILNATYTFPKVTDPIIEKIIEGTIRVNPEERLTVYEVLDLLKDYMPKKTLMSSSNMRSSVVMKSLTRNTFRNQPSSFKLKRRAASILYKG